MKSKGQLYHELAILEYAESFKDLGYKVNIPGPIAGKYSPDMIIVKDRKKTYIEFKNSSASLDTDYFSFKERILHKEPDSEFLLILLNDTYKPNLNIQLPKLNNILTLIFDKKIQNKLKADINYKGKYVIFNISINVLILGKVSTIKGSGIISYLVGFNEGPKKVVDFSEVPFNYQIKINGIDLLENKINQVISSKIELDKIR